MPFTEKQYKRQTKWDKEHYKTTTVKIDLETYVIMQKSAKYKTTNQFINQLIKEQLIVEQLIEPQGEP